MKPWALLIFLLIGFAAIKAQTASSPIPLLNTPLVPAAIAPGSHSFLLTLNGNGFTPASIVRWNGSARKTTFVSKTQLTARISAAEVAVASTAVVTVSNPVHHTSNPVLFQITTPERSIKMQVVPTGLSGEAIVADVDADGKPDLIVSYAASAFVSTLQIALGQGDGTFGTPQVISLPSEPLSVISGPFFPLGRTDVALALITGVYILHNQGGGVFGSLQKVNRLFLSSIAAADLDGDGRLDLVGVEQSAPGYIFVMLRTADGHFQAPVKYQTVDAPNEIAIGDFNRDGIADLAVVSSTQDNIAILLGNGDGTFQPQTVYSTGSASDGPTALLVADFNGDGNLDLARAAANFNAGTGILLGNGDGTFQAVRNANYSSYGLAAGDFDGDGILDVTMGVNSVGTGILLGKGDGTFSTLYNFDYPDFGDGVAVADFNNNGRLDIAATTDSGIVLLVQ